MKNENCNFFPLLFEKVKNMPRTEVSNLWNSKMYDDFFDAYFFATRGKEIYKTSKFSILKKRILKKYPEKITKEKSSLSS